MARRWLGDAAVVVAGLVASGLLVTVSPAVQVGAEDGGSSGPASRADEPQLSFLGRYETELGLGSAEIVAFDETSDLLYVVNSGDPSVDVVDLSDPAAPVRERRVDLDAFGTGVTSVAVHDGLAVTAVTPEDRTAPGSLVFFEADGTIVDAVTAGSLPDMVTFTPDGSAVLSANEGEPNPEYTVDPEGSVSVVNANPFKQSCDAADFSDVPDDHAFADEIGWMVERCQANGFDDGTFRPTLPVSRGAMAAFLYRLSGSPDGTDPACTDADFSDVPVSHPFCGEIAWMVEAGVTAGFPDDTFRPAQAISRQTAGAFLYRLAGSPDGVDPVCSGPAFTDVPADHAFCGEIAWMVVEGITSGFNDGTFRPTIAVSRQAMTAFIGRSIVRTVSFTEFDEGEPRHGEVSDDIRIFGPGASVAEDLEPEYVTVSADSSTGWVTLQENNAIARFDVRTAQVEALVPLGFKDHDVAGQGIDASDREVSNGQGEINIAEWPVRGMYMPDTVSSFQIGGETYLVTANEGDARDYDGFAEESRVKDLDLDATAFPDAAALQEDENIGRLTVTTANGNTDADAAFEELYAFGARSFSVWDEDGALVFDSGDDFEQITAAAEPDFFNSDNEEANFDNRSDNKGPEPEAITTGVLGETTYAFIGLERIGGVMVYDVTDPEAPTFVQYLNTRDFSVDAAPDSAPESIVYVPPADSPTGEALVLVSHEVSGTVVAFRFGSALPGTPESIAIAGSDTTQDVMDAVAEEYNGDEVYNTDPDTFFNILSQQFTPLVVDGDDECADLTYATPAVAPQVLAPNGSSNGRNALKASVQAGDGCIDIARSSGPPRAIGSDLATFEYYAFALDALGWASASTKAPDNLTLTQLRSIYNCTFTNWDQVGGTTGAIERYMPQTGSGTYQFFRDDVLGFDPVGFSSEECPPLQYTQENSGEAIDTNGDQETALVGYSMANWVAQARGTAPDQRFGQTMRDLNGENLITFPGGVATPNTAGPVDEDNVKLNNPTPAYPGIRYVFNVIDSTHVTYDEALRYVGFENQPPSDLVPPVVSPLCDGAKAGTIEDYGFGALDTTPSSRNLPGSTCRLFTP